MKFHILFTASAALFSSVSANLTSEWAAKQKFYQEKLAEEKPESKDVRPMMSIPVPRNASHWEPRMNIKTQYGAVQDGTNQIFALAKLELNTTRPSIRLENFVHIKKISCHESPKTGPILDLEFDSAIHAQRAYNAWSSTPDMGILLGHEHGCNGHEVGHFSLVNLSFKGSKNPTQLSMAVERKERHELVQDWHVSVTHYKMDLANSTAASNEENHLKKRYDSAHNFTIPLSFNTADPMKHIGSPFFWFLGCQFIGCEGCYTQGQAQIQTEFRGSWLSLKSYKMRVVGNFFANINLRLSAVPAQESYLWWNYLTIVSMSPFSVPGVFILGPQFRIMGAVVAYADTEVTGKVGFDVNIPFDHEIASNDLAQPAQVKNNHKTKFNYHRLNLTVFDPKPTYVGGHVMLAPELGVGLTLGKTKIVDLAVRVQNQIGFIHRYGNLTHCPGEKPSTEIFHRHKFQHTYGPAPFISLIYTDWDSQLLPIACIDCNNCPDDQPVFAPSNHDLSVANTTRVFASDRDATFHNMTRKFNSLMDSR